MEKGKYIVIDGLDGAGKSSLFLSLQKVFQGDFLKNENFAYTREPGGTPLGEKLRKILIDDPMDPFTELCLFSAQRREGRKMVEGFLSKGTHVISDRSDSASFAYQICGREKFDMEDLFWDLNKYLKPFPTLYIFLDLSVDVAFDRLQVEKKESKDRFETENVNFHNRVRQGFHDFARKVSIPCVFVNAEAAPDEVACEVIRHIKNHIAS